MPKKCEIEDCTISPIFGIPGGKSRFCVSHKLAGMVDVKHKTCAHEGCDSRPSFDVPGGNGRFCVSHKVVGMIDVKSKRCEHMGCNSISPIFNTIGGKGRFCGVHKLEGMVDVKSKRCEHGGCDSRPSFDILGGNGRFCVMHKAVGMVDVISKRCEHEGCDSRPGFDNKGGKGRFCVSHKLAGMVDVKHKICEYEGCDSRPSFDVLGGKARFCVTHKLAGMMDVRSKRCKYDGCSSIRPSFDIIGGEGRFCRKHKHADMVNVISKRCEHEGCESRTLYGKPGLSQSHCAKHRKLGMIRNSNAKCSDCKEPAMWGQNWIPLRCVKHKIENDENFVEKRCSSCGLLYILDKDNKCENCNPVSWATARLSKQKALMDYLDARGLHGEYTDTIVDNGICGKERPDRTYDFGDKIVILECDEHQHRDRACLCEQTRMINIGQSFGGLPVYFIRWNPDEYIPKSDKKNPESLKKRYTLVGDILSDIQTGKIELPSALVSVLYVYYDGWSSLADEEWKTLSSYDKTFLPHQ